MGPVGGERRGHSDASGRPTGRRLSVPDAAEVLGITAEAVRGRIRRGTLRTVREAGRVYVLLAADQSRPTADQPTDRTDQLIATLREQLAAERRANEENRRIIAALTQRIPEIEAPREGLSEPPESPTAATEQPGRVEPQAQVEGAKEGTEPRSWWRRMFGG